MTSHYQPGNPHMDGVAFPSSVWETVVRILHIEHVLAPHDSEDPWGSPWKLQDIVTSPELKHVITPELLHFPLCCWVVRVSTPVWAMASLW